MRLSSLAVVLLALTLTSRVAAQLIVELPFNAGIPAREMRGSETVGADLRAARQEPRPIPASRPSVPRPVVPVPVRPLESIISLLEPIGPLTPASAERMAFIPLSPPPPEPIVISSFDGTAGSGGIRAGTTWVGQVTQGVGYLTIGGTARDDNGWGATGLSVNATGLNYITITAQRDAGHAASSLFLQLEDRYVGTRVFGLDSSLFAVGTPTQVQIVLGVWSGGFDFTQITGWNIGGGSLGTLDFRMTLHDVTLTASAIPEPATYAALMGAALLGLAVVRRRRKT